MPAFRNLAGQKFARWFVVSWHHKAYATHFWSCICECGTKKVVNGTSLKKGTSKSCGCLNQETITLHGMEGTPTYYSWMSMKQRCQNSKAPDYYRYGGRGIDVCSEWQTFANFLRDMGVRPRNKTLDRIDNNGPYTPENCRWETKKRQSRNRNDNRHITFNGQTKVLAQWADDYGVSRKLLLNRLSAGWAVEDALTKPPRPKR